MAFRLRRGTDAERLIITPEEGELIYTTDSKKIFVGDGNTLGGNAVDTTSLINLESELGNLSIDSFGDVNSDSTVPSDGDVLAYDAATGDWRASTVSGGGVTSIVALTDVDGTGLLNDDVLVYNSVTANFERETFRLEALRDVTFSNLNNSVLVYDNVAGTFNQTQSLNNNIVDENGITILDANLAEFNGALRGDVLSEDSSVILSVGIGDTDSTLFANVTGNVTGDTEGTHTGLVVGNVTGDVTGNLTGSVTGSVTGDVVGSVFGDDSTLMIDAVNNLVTTDILTTNVIKSGGTLNVNQETDGQITQIEVESVSEQSNLKLTRKASTDISSDNVVYGGLYFQRDDTGGEVATALMLGYSDKLVWAVDEDGTFPQSQHMVFDSQGRLGVGNWAPTEKLVVDGNAVVTGFVQFGSLTTVERDALTAANGMVIYNTTDNKFQGYENGAWANLI